MIDPDHPLAANHEALDHPHALWLALLDAAPVRVWLLDQHHRVVWASRQACNLLSQPLQRIIGCPPEQIFLDPTLKDDLSEREKALSGRVGAWAGWSEYLDGRHRFTSRTFLPCVTPPGIGPYYFEYTLDQTDLMEARDRAERAERRLREAIRALPDGLGIEDEVGRIILCNATYASLYGLSEDALVGMGFDERAMRLAPRICFLGGADEAGDDTTGVDRLMQRRRSVEPLQIRAQDGREFVLRRANTSDGGRIVLYNDLSELRDGWDILKEVFEGCPTPITMADVEDGGIVFMNRAAHELMRFDGNAADSTVPHWRSPEDRAAYVTALRRHGRVDGWEHTFRRGDGSDVHLAMWSRLAEHGGRPVIVTTSIDLTEKRAEEADRDRQRAALHQAEKLAAMGEMLAGIGHELNNPLSVLVGQATILSETATDATFRHRAELITDAAARCARVVRGFLDIARQQPARLASTDLSTVLDAALLSAGERIDLSGIRIEIDRGASPLHAWGDADQLRQVFVNLIVNAAQAMLNWPHQRRLDIVLREGRDGMADVTVCDTGPGIPDALLEKVFQPLFSTKAATGSGIGLALCQRIVETHGGRIAAVSSPCGAKFRISLPLAQGRKAVTADDPPGRQALRVLIVDDDQEVLQTTVELLRLHGHYVREASSAPDALDLLSANPSVDAIVSDVHMPDMDGVALFHAIRRRWPALAHRFAFASGRSVGEAAKARAAEISRPWIEKPFLPEEMEAVLQHLAGSSKAMDERL